MLSVPNSPPSLQSDWRHKLNIVIFEHDTPMGKAFDVSLLVAIFASIILVMLESVSEVSMAYGEWLTVTEWILTILFTLEYGLRLITAEKPIAYIFSFFGLVDLLSIVPTYVGLFVPGSQALRTIRALRLLRVFRVLKLVKYVEEARAMGSALQASARKILVFLGTVLTLTIIMGSFMYLIEGAENGFTSIPRSVYWAIVTMTTVGYGDIAPQTVLGQMVASMIMIFGYGIIAVPTGIVSVELARGMDDKPLASCCDGCGLDNHDSDAQFCKHCGVSL